MDVHCSSCGEPWDTFHLWQDAIHDTSLDGEEAQSWRTLPRDEQLSSRYRALFERADWCFGDSILEVRHCPCCSELAKRDFKTSEIKSAIVELYGDDEDAIAAVFEELES